MKIIYSIAVFILAYLMGSFYSATFDISTWSEITRFMVVLTGSVVVGFMGILNYLEGPSKY